MTRTLLRGITGAGLARVALAALDACRTRRAHAATRATPRTVLVAWDGRDAAEHLAAYPLPGRVFVVTKRTPHAVRGITAHSLVLTPLAVARRAELEEALTAAVPCIYAR